MARVHLLNQYLWPDSAPTGIYTEMLADRLAADGIDAVLVGGGGSYRESARPAPATPIVRLRAQQGKRGSHLSTLAEYWSVNAAFADYIRREVREGDVVVISSAPPLTIHLHRAIHERRAIAVYWLQDYYPDLLRGVWEYPGFIRTWLQRHWQRHLGAWDRVVKSAANLGYHGTNASTIRNWPTLDFPSAVEPAPKTALYTGNFGYGHDVNAFIAMCEKLHQDGWRISVRGDGPGMAKLPEWIETGRPFANADELRGAMQRAALHLVAAHPRIRQAIFPSKIWNSLGAGRPIEASGFEGEMAEELEATVNAPFHEHPGQWEQLIVGILARSSSPTR